MAARTARLFSRRELRGVLEDQEDKGKREIQAIPPKALLEANVEELLDHLESQYRLRVPILREDEVTVDQSEAKVDVSGDRYRVIHDRSRPFVVNGTRVTVHIPFDGDAELLDCKASRFNFNPPAAEIRSGEVVLTYQDAQLEAEALRERIASDLKSLNEHLGWVQSDVDPFNEKLRGKLATTIEKRREKLKSDQALVTALGYPVRRRADAPRTYAVPQKRRKRPMADRPSAVSQGPLEPALDNQEYEHILSVIENMMLVIERSPRAFAQMDEEDLRTHFLVHLNGQYEGSATGETFNATGKTDILIREEGKNLFIAECKFWNGPKALAEAIDQLLGYVSWRDTKTALILFNRRRHLSSVLEKIPGAVQKHRNYVREVPYTHETGFRYELHHRDDPERHLTMTVLVFEVPSR